MQERCIGKSRFVNCGEWSDDRILPLVSQGAEYICKTGNDANIGKLKIGAEFIKGMAQSVTDLVQFVSVNGNGRPWQYFPIPEQTSYVAAHDPLARIVVLSYLTADYDLIKKATVRGPISLHY